MSDTFFALVMFWCNAVSMLVLCPIMLFNPCKDVTHSFRVKFSEYIYEPLKIHFGPCRNICKCRTWIGRESGNANWLQAKENPIIVVVVMTFWKKKSQLGLYEEFYFWTHFNKVRNFFFLKGSYLQWVHRFWHAR